MSSFRRFSTGLTRIFHVFHRSGNETKLISTFSSEQRAKIAVGDLKGILNLRKYPFKDGNWVEDGTQEYRRGTDVIFIKPSVLNSGYIADNLEAVSKEHGDKLESLGVLLKWFKNVRVIRGFCLKNHEDDPFQDIKVKWTYGFIERIISGQCTPSLVELKILMENIRSSQTARQYLDVKYGLVPSK